MTSASSRAITKRSITFRGQSARWSADSDGGTGRRGGTNDQSCCHTAPPSIRCLVINYPNADGMDKWAMAVNAALGKMSQADRDSFFGTTVADSRRDILARVTHFGHK